MLGVNWRKVIVFLRILPGKRAGAIFPFSGDSGQKKLLKKLKDMESPRPMDRLICGDAGYGKTEIAIRAAFKAVMDGKQVAVLAPTTSSEQHYVTFGKE